MSALLRRFRALPRTAVIALVAAAVFAASLGVAAAVGGTDGGTQETTDAGNLEDTTTSATPSPTGSDSATEGSQDGAGTGGVNNEVVVLNQTDGLFRNRAGFGTARVVGDTVDNQNSAAAYSECTDCRTVAVAVQIVLVQSNANTITPNNIALALNYGCQSCETFAGAYQYVLSTDGLVRFSSEGESRMAAIQDQIRQTAALDIPFPELDARLGELVDQLWAVVDEELISLGVKFEGTPSAQTDVDTSAGETPSPTPTSTEVTPTGSGEAGAGGTSDGPSPTPEESPTSQQSATPEDSPTPAESPTPTSSPSPTG